MATIVVGHQRWTDVGRRDPDDPDAAKSQRPAHPSRDWGSKHRRLDGAYELTRRGRRDDRWTQAEVVDAKIADCATDAVGT